MIDPGKILPCALTACDRSLLSSKNKARKPRVESKRIWTAVVRHLPLPCIGHKRATRIERWCDKEEIFREADSHQPTDVSRMSLPHALSQRNPHLLGSCLHFLMRIDFGQDLKRDRQAMIDVPHSTRTVTRRQEIHSSAKDTGNLSLRVLLLHPVTGHTWANCKCSLGR